MSTSTWAVTATLAAVGVTLLAAAVPFGGPPVCPLVGADPGVAIQPASREMIDRFAAAEVCIDDTCGTVTLALDADGAVRQVARPAGRP